MPNFISVCKNVIASNNKKNWVDPDPSIRVSSSKSGKVIMHSNHVVAEVMATTDGKPVISCGTKVGLITEYDVVEITSIERNLNNEPRSI